MKRISYQNLLDKLDLPKIFFFTIIFILFLQFLMSFKKELFWGFVFDLGNPYFSTFFFLISITILIIISREDVQKKLLLFIQRTWNFSQKFPKYSLPTLVIILSAIIFWIFRVKTELGDHWILKSIGSATGICDGCPSQGINDFFYPHSPLASYINAILIKFWFLIGGSVPKTIVQISSVIIGIISVLCLWYFARKLFSSPLRRFFFISFVMTSGFILLFFGYKEIMQYAIIPLILYFLASYLALKNKINLIWPTFFLCVSFWMHISVGWFFPSLFLLYYFKSGSSIKPIKFRVTKEMIFGILIGFILPSLLFAGFAELAVPEGDNPLFSATGEIGHFANGLFGSLMFPESTANINNEEYSRFSLEHFLAILNENFLIANISLILILLIFLKYQKTILKDRYAKMLFVAYIFFQIYAIFLKQITWLYHPMWDWDLFSFLAIPLVILGGYLLLKHTSNRDMVSLSILGIFAGLIFTVPMILHVSAYGDTSGTTPYWENDGLFFDKAGYNGTDNTLRITFITLGRFSETEDGFHKINADVALYNSNNGELMFVSYGLFEDSHFPVQPWGIFEEFPLEITFSLEEVGDYFFTIRLYDEISGRETFFEFPFSKLK